jgi:hypothetical protein
LKNFYRSPFLKWPPQYHTNSTLFDFNEISYVGRLWCPELIPDIAKFLPVSIFKMATTILQKIKLRICHNAKCSFKLLSVAGLGDFIIVRLLSYLVIKSPKQSLGDLLFLLRFLLLFLLLLLFLFFSFLSADHELVHGRSQELLDRISWNLVEL